MSNHHPYESFNYNWRRQTLSLDFEYNNHTNISTHQMSPPTVTISNNVNLKFNMRKSDSEISITGLTREELHTYSYIQYNQQHYFEMDRSDWDNIQDHNVTGNGKSNNNIRGTSQSGGSNHLGDYYSVFGKSNYISLWSEGIELM